MLRNEISGTGRLVSRQDSLQEWEVRYYFQIDTRIRNRRITRYYSHGVVRAQKNTAIPDGEYDLHTDDGVLRVVNLGLGGWAILMSSVKS